LLTSGQARRGEAFRTPPGSKDSNGKEESSGAAGSLLGYFCRVLPYVSLFYVYNPPMTSSNWIKIIIAACVGIMLGLIYGWVINPIQYTDVTPNILREDYRADYVLMVAEAYQSELNADTAAKRLAILGSDAPTKFVTDTLDFGAKNGFTQQEVATLQILLTAMQTYQPQGNNSP
jgi:hypothetical protein